ncbi:MAG: hypothetical protein ACRD19_03085 [Terriglobia bacterium]
MSSIRNATLNKFGTLQAPRNQNLFPDSNFQEPATIRIGIVAVKTAGVAASDPRSTSGRFFLSDDNFRVAPSEPIKCSDTLATA